jgi:hypothetical protein
MHEVTEDEGKLLKSDEISSGMSNLVCKITVNKRIYKRLRQNNKRTFM